MVSSVVALLALAAQTEGQNRQARPLLTAHMVPPDPNPVPHTPKTVKVDLSWPAKDRWNFTKTDPFFKNASADIKSYVTSVVPSILWQPITWITSHMRSCFQDEYVDEMTGLADGLGSWGNDGIDFIGEVEEKFPQENFRV